MHKPSAVSLFILTVTTACATEAAAVQEIPAKTLRAMLAQDYFSADPGDMYTGVSDVALREDLNAKVTSAIEALAMGIEQGRDHAWLMVTFKQHLEGVDRDLLETEDAERVALVFERMLDALGIESSEGALNTWLYGFDPSEGVNQHPKCNTHENCWSRT